MSPWIGSRSSRPASASTRSPCGATSSDRGLLVGATLNRLDISSNPVAGATQYMVVAVFATGEGHHAHDSHPGFQEWNAIADTYQVGDAMAFGGETIVQLNEA